MSFFPHQYRSIEIDIDQDFNIVAYDELDVSVRGSG